MTTQNQPYRNQVAPTATSLSLLAMVPLTLGLTGCGFYPTPFDTLQAEEAPPVSAERGLEPTGFLAEIDEAPLIQITEQAPSPEDPDDNIIFGEFVIQLRPDNSRQLLLDDLGQLQTGDIALDEDLYRLVRDKAQPLSETVQTQPLDMDLARARLQHSFVFQSDHPVDDVIETLQLHDQVEWVEPLRKLHSFRQVYDPAFSHYDFQWNMRYLEVDHAWDFVDGKGAVVAVIDAASALNGSDAPESVLGGMDLVDWEQHDYSFTPTDNEFGHGSHVAGTIAQATGNGIGAVGVAPGATILPIRVLDLAGDTNTSVVALGIYFAVFRGADIINLSLGGLGRSRVLEQACEFAYDQGVTVVAAAGNQGYTDAIAQPAVFPTTIAVGASNIYGSAASYSNSSFELDLLAPGGDQTPDVDRNGFLDGILQQRCPLGLSENCDYTFGVGTSSAAPHVSGIAALFHEMGLRNPDHVRDVLIRTAEDWGYGWSHDYGYGVVDLAAAFEYLGYPAADQQ